MHYASKTAADAPPASSIFTVKNGEIHAYPTQKAGSEQPNAYIVTDADYKDYVLSLEYKWGEKKFRAAPRTSCAMPGCCTTCIASARRTGRPAPKRRSRKATPAIPGRCPRRFRASSIRRRGRYALPENGGVPVTVGKNGDFERTRHGRVNEYPGWNTLEVIVRGDRATHIVNGVVNMRVSDIKSLGRGPNSWVKLDHGKIALQAESAELFYRNIKVRPLTKADDMPPEPKLTEVWFPVPAKVTPGATPGARAVRCHHAVRRQEPRRLEERQDGRRRGLEDRQRRDGGRRPAPATSRPRRVFGDVQLHVEWRDPQLPPDKVNQDRGNSGIFLQDVYEVQVLDNFENPTYVNGMVGSIYKQFPPLVNATWPAETWNTYDIIFTAPRFAADGSLTSPARLTVLLNGVLVQNNAVLKGGTTYIGAPSYRPHGDMPLRLQDHGHLVRFRNIWLRKL